MVLKSYKFSRAFALLDVILAVVLLAIATIGSYALIKSFRSNSEVQQLTRYATNIAQNFTPFLEGAAFDTVLSDDGDGDKLEQEFLLSIAIPQEDLASCEDGYCWVNSGIYAGGAESVLDFAKIDQDSTTGASYLIQALTATATETNAITQGLGNIFSVYCVAGSGKKLSDATTSCSLLAESKDIYSVFLVFPKSGSTPPSDSDLTPQA